LSDKYARSGLDSDVARHLKRNQRFTHGRATDAQLLCQLSLRWQRTAGYEIPTLNARDNGIGDLSIKSFSFQYR